MNENLAIVGSNALVLDSPEDTLTQEASLIEKQASSVAVTNDAEYAAAKAVKKMQEGEGQLGADARERQGGL